MSRAAHGKVDQARRLKELKRVYGGGVPPPKHLHLGCQKRLFTTLL